MFRRISIAAIFLGFIASQAAAWVGAIILVVVLLFVYGNRALAALFEDCVVVAIVIFLSLASVVFGGYVARSVAQENRINAAFVGLVALLLHGLLMHLSDYAYATDHPWILLVGAALFVPAGLLGARIHNASTRNQRMNLPRVCGAIECSEPHWKADEKRLRQAG